MNKLWTLLGVLVVGIIGLFVDKSKKANEKKKIEKIAKVVHKKNQIITKAKLADAKKKHDGTVDSDLGDWVNEQLSTDEPDTLH